MVVVSDPVDDLVGLSELDAWAFYIGIELIVIIVTQNIRLTEELVDNVYFRLHLLHDIRYNATVLILPHCFDVVNHDILLVFLFALLS